MKLALIGQSIQYSLSPIIYKRLLTQKFPKFDFKLLDLSPPEFEDFMNSKNYKEFDALCITQPYKSMLSSYFSAEEQGIVQSIGIANFLVNFRTSQGDYSRLFNTDLPALHHAFPWSLILSHHSLIVLGTGAMARVLAIALEQQFEPRLIYCVGRNHTKAKQVVDYANQKTHHTWKTLEPHELQKLKNIYAFHATSAPWSAQSWELSVTQLDGVFDLNYQFQPMQFDPCYWDGLPLLIYQCLFNIEQLQGASFEILPSEAEDMLKDRSWILLSQASPTAPPSKEL